MTDSYFTCPICAAKRSIVGYGDESRDNIVCSSCGAKKRDVEAVQAFLCLFGEGRYVSLSSFAKGVMDRKVAAPDILDIAYESAFARPLSATPSYKRAYFWPSGKAQTTQSGKTLDFADLENLACQDGSLDVIVTHDALPFVGDIGKAWREIARALRPGGVAIMTAPTDWPLPERTEEIASENEQREHLTPDGSRMRKRRNIGADMADQMKRNAMRPIIRRMSFATDGRGSHLLVGIRA